jgi:hypothetical protein
MVLFGKAMCFSYTGLSMLNGMSTGEWLAEVLSGAEDEDIINACRRIMRHARYATLRPEVVRLPSSKSLSDKGSQPAL